MKKPRSAGRQAFGVRIVLGGGALPVGIEGPGPWLERNLAHFQIGGQVHPGVVNAAGIRCQRRAGIALPHAFFSRKRAQVDASVRPVRRRPSRLVVAGTIQASAVEAGWRLFLRYERERERAQ